MLNVPDEIKELLHRDSCKKNIRIVFPNKERSDICNDLIVKDSVSFTESLCSQDTLKFGLCEAAQFECETVGVGNIKGATIRVFCEIFCPSSVQDALWQTDLQAWVYQIPYGTFIVNSCDRQADMIHRRIVAYGKLNTIDMVLGIGERAKIGTTITSNANYTPSTFYFLAGNNIDFKDVFTRSEIPKTTTSTTNLIPRSYTKTKSWRRSSSYKYFCMLDSTFLHDWRIYTKNAEYPLIDTGIDFESRNGWKDDIRNFLMKWDCPQETIDYYINYLNPSIRFRSDALYSSNTIRFDKNETIYKVLTGVSSANDCYIYIRVPMTYSLSIVSYEYSTDPGTVMDTLTIDFTQYEEPKMYDKKLLDDYSFLDTFNLIFKRYKVAKYDGDTVYRISLNNTDLKELLNSYLEICGLFGEVNRDIDNSVTLKNIKQLFGLLPSSTLYPESALYPQGVTGGKLLPNDYQTCWYDDNYVNYFGCIHCIYKDGNNVENDLIYYLTGYDADTDAKTYQIYDLTNNSIIKAKTWTYAEILEILQTIAANIEGVTYMPVEFVGRGLPYVEAGDTFEILTKSNDSITTIVLNRTLTGEMTLTDTYKST